MGKNVGKTVTKMKRKINKGEVIEGNGPTPKKSKSE